MKNKKINDMFKLDKESNDTFYFILQSNDTFKFELCYMTIFKDLNKTLTLLLGQKKNPTQLIKLSKFLS